MTRSIEIPDPDYNQWYEVTVTGTEVDDDSTGYHAFEVDDFECQDTPEWMTLTYVSKFI